MLRCKEVSRLVSESLDRDLSWWTRIRLRIHLWMCRLCAAFRDDLYQLHQDVQKADELLEQEQALTEIRLSEDARRRIRQALKGQS